MGTSKKDPTYPMRLKASRYPGVDEGTACTQSSFKVGGKAFLFVGPQGGRFKAMFRLKESVPEITGLASTHPDSFEVASGWSTARFGADNPLPKKLWTKWLDESYRLAAGGAPGKRAGKTGGRKTSGKAGSKKKAAKRATAGKVVKKTTTRTKTAERKTGKQAASRRVARQEPAKKKSASKKKITKRR